MCRNKMKIQFYTRKFFPKIFLPKGRLTFCCIFGAKNYGGKGVFCSPNRGGGSFCMLSIYQTGFSLLLTISGVLHHSTRAKRYRIRAKQGENEFLFGVLWCFLGIFGDRKGRNVNIFLKCGCKVNAGCGAACLPFDVSTCGRWSGSRACSLLSWCAPSILSALLLYACRVACKYGSIWRFKGVFGVVWVACVGLCGFGALRGLWGFCVRERLGGLKACGVFAPAFILLSSAFLLL